MRSALIAVGSNMPSTTEGPIRSVLRSMTDVAALVGPVMARSRLYATPCFPAGAGPDYVNAAMLVMTSLSPWELLAALHAIEADHGRERVQRWGMRTLDLDLLALDELVLPDATTQAAWRDMPPDMQKMRAPDELILPHPRMQDRAFVLVPLADVAPGWRHPGLGRSVAQMLAALPPEARQEVIPIDAPEP